jgi:hypothetical protein
MAAEQSVRAAAVTSLANAIVHNNASLRQQIDANTAVAVAMGGGVFLPDKTFNLTLNLGAMGGETAYAAQLQALISPNMALNIAVGSGSHTGTAVRGGVTIGW